MVQRTSTEIGHDSQRQKIMSLTIASFQLHYQDSSQTPNTSCTIMRNPIEMTYSIFWFSCRIIHVYRIPRGPDIFHERMMTKIDSFNDCMRDDSSPNISYACTIQDKANYSSCIKQRLHLLDKCYKHVLMDIYSPELPNCGPSWLSVAIYYVNVRKWLKLVPRERLLFLTLEELKLHPSEVAGDILQFLDLNTSIASNKESMEIILRLYPGGKEIGACVCTWHFK